MRVLIWLALIGLFAALIWMVRYLSRTTHQRRINHGDQFSPSDPQVGPYSDSDRQSP